MGTCIGEPIPSQTGCVPMALEVKHQQVVAQAQTRPLSAFFQGQEGLGELTADHVDVRCQAAVDLCRGQAHLGGAKEGPRSKADSL